MKKLILILILLICIKFTNNNLEHYCISHLTIDSVKVEPDTYKVTATMYYATPGQCDTDPLVTAGMYKIKPNKASEQKWIAMSRDMIARWGGNFKYGDMVKVEGAGHKDGIYTVVDTMNKRFKNRIDFLETKGTKPYKFTNVKLTKWNQENLLASI